MTEAKNLPSAARLLQLALDLAPVNVAITDANGRVLHLNACAAAMLAAGDPIWCRHGRLGATTSKATAGLLAAIASAARARLRADATRHEVALPCRDGSVALAYVRSLDFDAELADHHLGAAAALFITRLNRATPPIEALSRYFELTPAQVRVLEQIASGKNRIEAATALGLADSTVKTHLGNLYAKTGTTDQSELCRLVTTLSWPNLSFAAEKLSRSGISIRRVGDVLVAD